MGKGRKRNTAKTGDKALYAAAGANSNVLDDSSRRKRKDDDNDAVESFHDKREQDFLSLEPTAGGSRKDDEDEEVFREHHVMDLGAGGDSSSDDDDDSSSDEEDNSNDGRVKQDMSSQGTSSDDSESDVDEAEKVDNDPRNWGRKKSAYYSGDTGDLEIGQDEDDAFVEEEAAREVQSSRYKQMDDDDFVLSGDDDDDDKQDDASDEKAGLTDQQEKLTGSRDISKLSKKDRKKLLEKQHPELLPVVGYFADVVRDLKESTSVATRALTQSNDAAESVGATIEGKRFLLTKAMIQNSLALNTVMYLLLKSGYSRDESNEATIDSHPVMAQLKDTNSVMQKLDTHVQQKVEGIEEQLDSLVKAAALLQSSNETFGESEAEAVSSDDDGSSQGLPESLTEARAVANSTDALPKSESSPRDSTVKKIGVLNEARFGLRQSEVDRPKARNRRSVNKADFGDLDVADSKSFASSINAIEQRSKVMSRKRRAAPVAEELVEHEEFDDRLAEGLKMMEAEMGEFDDSREETDDAPRSNRIDDDEELNDGLGFYNSVAKAGKRKKALKQSLYRVAPKFPRQEHDVDGERAINRTIMKNRGLVAHKAKIDRNPRVKKREQYRRALIRRKGAVREIRENESQNYGGEKTGIKSGISRSRKLLS